MKPFESARAARRRSIALLALMKVRARLKLGLKERAQLVLEDTPVAVAVDHLLGQTLLAALALVANLLEGTDGKAVHIAWLVCPERQTRAGLARLSPGSSQGRRG